MRPLLVGDIFDNLARTASGRTAAVVDDRSITFGDMFGASTDCARALAARRVVKGSRVVHWSDPALGTMALFVALARLGAVYAPLSTHLRFDEASSTAAQVAPALLVVDRRHAEPGAELAGALGVEHVVIDDLLEHTPASAPPPRPAIAEDDPHVIFFTSGSTGRSKGVVLSHRVSVLRSHPGALLEPRGAAVIPYPLFHMAAWTQAMQQWHGRDTAVFTSADPADICAAIERHGATRINAIPGVWRRVLDHVGTPQGRRHDLSSVRFADTGTSATPPDLLDAITAALPQAWVRIFYGATETGAATMLELPDVHRKPGSAGQVAPLAEVRVAPSGELQVRGPQVFDEYFGDPVATTGAFDDGWYRTGDLAEIDDDGFVTIVGRLGDLIRTGGETVVPAEVEAVVIEHPSVLDVAVVGIRDPSWGEVVCAAVVLVDGAPCPTVDELEQLCRDRFARFKRPRRVVVVDAVPRTPATGQVQRRRVADLAARASST